jgi:Rieske Fe-S protein
MTASREPGPTEPARRRFLARLTVAIGGAMAAVLVYPVARYLLFPVRRRVVSSAAGPVDAGPARAVQAGGPPVRVALAASSVRDAWGVTADVPLGACWLVKSTSGEVRAFSATCPHLGCSVDFAADEGVFKCPCHDSAFSPAGDRLSGPAKRGLDPLPVEHKGGRLLVTFQRFRADVPGREPVE